MKTWEVYKNELEQPKQIYLRKLDGVNYRFDIYRGLLPCEWREAMWTTIKADDEWELVRKPVNFMTAVNSGKMIKGPLDNAFHEVKYQLSGVLTLDEVNSKWLIE